MRFRTVSAAVALAVASAADATGIESVRRLPNGMEVRTTDGLLTLEPWSDSIIHVRFGPPGYRGNYNPSVIATPGKAHFTVGQTADSYLLSTPRLTVKVAKASSAVSFADEKGIPLLEEAERAIGNGTTDAFATKTIVYGLGQHQNGQLGYTGTIHLQQKNGDVGVPFLLSPSGFGILWHSA